MDCCSEAAAWASLCRDAFRNARIVRQTSHLSVLRMRQNPSHVAVRHEVGVVELRGLSGALFK